MKRDYSLDFFRGFAALNIILIHTVTWSGTLYLPSWIATIVMMLGVPFFMFLAGWSKAYNANVEKTIKSCISMYLKYLFFITLYFISLYFIKGSEPGGIFNYLYFVTFQDAKSTVLPVIMGSMWYLPMYITYVPIYVLMINLMKKYGRDFNNLLKVVIFSFFVLFIWTQQNHGFLFFSREFFFYGLFFMLGYYSKDHKVKSFVSMMILTVAPIIAAYVITNRLYMPFEINNDIIFPPHLVYLLLSLPTVFVAMYLKQFIKPKQNNPLVMVGRNALWFYFAQGIFSSILLYVAPQIKMFWVIKLIILFVVNVLVTTVFATILNYLYKYLSKLVNIIVKHISLFETY